MAIRFVEFDFDCAEAAVSISRNHSRKGPQKLQVWFLSSRNVFFLFVLAIENILPFADSQNKKQLKRERKKREKSLRQPTEKTKHHLTIVIWGNMDRLFKSISIEVCAPLDDGIHQCHSFCYCYYVSISLICH